MTQEPPPIGSQANVPRDLEKTVERCLRKDPDRRFQHIGDVRVALEDLKDERQSGATAAAAAQPRRRVILVAAVAVVSLLIGTAGSWLYWRPQPPKPLPILTRLTVDEGLTTDPALSPDGKMIAYASDRAGDGNLDIWVQQLASGEAIRLTRDPADDHEPYFSPDGGHIIFRSEREGGGIYVVPTFGGDTRLVVAEGHAPRYSPDGHLIAYWTGFAGSAGALRTWVVSADGRTKRELNIERRGISAPIWLPDGKSLLATTGATLERGGPSAAFDWWAVPLDNGSPVKVGAGPVLHQQGLARLSRPEWMPPNHLLFSASSGDATDIWRVTISLAGLQVDSRAERVTAGTGRAVKPSAASQMVAFAAEDADDAIWSLNLTSGSKGTGSSLNRLTTGSARNSRPSLSLDGGVMAFHSVRGGKPHIRIQDRPGAERALTNGTQPEYWPVVSREGAKVAFSTALYPSAENRKAGMPLLVADTRTGVVQVACAECYRPEDWAPDGHRILISWPNPAPDVYSELAVFDLVTKQRNSLIKVPRRSIVSGRFSPDGRWLSFTELSGLETRRVWVAPLDSEHPVPPERWIPITENTAIDREARWSSDGGTLYFTSNRDGFTCIWTQRLDPGTKRPVGRPAALRHFHTSQLGFTLGDSGMFGLSIGGDRMVISLGQTTGNIWLIRQGR